MLLRISKTPDNFLWLRKYGLKWFDSNPVNPALMEEADPEGKQQRGAGCQQLPGSHRMEQEEGLEVTRS